jgi:UDP-glucuronate 4-epimerase
VLEEKIGKKAIVEWLPMHAGDVPVTYADVDQLSRTVGYRPRTSIDEGVSHFVAWYRDYYKQ